jgi:hypothetical protein
MQIIVMPGCALWRTARPRLGHGWPVTLVRRAAPGYLRRGPPCPLDIGSYGTARGALIETDARQIKPLSVGNTDCGLPRCWCDWIALVAFVQFARRP